MKDVTAATFAEEILANPQPVLIDFWAEWCAPCKALAPTLEKLAERFKNEVAFVKLNVDENKDLSKEYAVRGIPTLLLMKDGKELSRTVGSRSLTQLTTFLSDELGLALGATAEPAVRRSAFRGLSEFKEARLAALREHIDRKRLDLTASMWDDERIQDALQFVAEKSAPDDCAEVLGVPTALVFAVGALSSYYRTNIGAAEYELEWLESVPPDADLSNLPGRLLGEILRSEHVTAFVEGSAALSRARDSLATLHETDCDDEVPAAQWVSLQEQLAATEDTENWTHRTLAGILKGLARSLRRDDEILRDAIGRITTFAWHQIRFDYGWQDAEDRTVLGLFDEIRQRMIDETGTFDRDRMEEQAANEQPALIERFHRQYEDGQVRIREIGQSFSRILLARANPS